MREKKKWPYIKTETSGEGSNSATSLKFEKSNKNNSS